MESIFSERHFVLHASAYHKAFKQLLQKKSWNNKSDFFFLSLHHLVTKPNREIFVEGQEIRMSAALQI